MLTGSCAGRSCGLGVMYSSLNGLRLQWQQFVRYAAPGTESGYEAAVIDSSAAPIESTRRVADRLPDTWGRCRHVELPYAKLRERIDDRVVERSHRARATRFAAVLPDARPSLCLALRERRLPLRIGALSMQSVLQGTGRRSKMLGMSCPAALKQQNSAIIVPALERNRNQFPIACCIAYSRLTILTACGSIRR